MTKTEQLSQEFSEIIRGWLTDDELAEVIRRNATPEYEGDCATHDFCDPNQAMLCGWEKVFPAHDIFSDENMYIGRQAWNLSKYKNFQ